MYCVALTGNIASGKSTALALFKSLGIMTISADQISRELTTTNTTVLNAIHHYFGNDVFDQHNLLNRRALRELIFNDPTKRHWLEELLHPLIRKEIEKQIKVAQAPYCVIEIPLLLDRSHFPYLNRVLLISCDEAIQIARVMARDHCSHHQALLILKSQPSNQARVDLADDIIINNNDISELEILIKKQHEIYQKLSPT